jgi:hypothetical protein
MIVHQCTQGTDEWKQLRCGVPTASEFIIYRSRTGELDENQAAYVKAILKAGMTEKEAAEAAGYKKPPTAKAVQQALAGLPVGDFSDAAKDAAFRKAIERIGGQLLDGGFENWGMRRGHELEPLARKAHQIQLGEVVYECGFVTTDDGRFGASLDGMIGHRVGGAEYKGFANPGKLRRLLLENDFSGIMDQCQGAIEIAELQWIDFCIYCPELESAGSALKRWRIFRDDAYIKALFEDLNRFDALVVDYIGRIKLALGGALDQNELNAIVPAGPTPEQAREAYDQAAVRVQAMSSPTPLPARELDPFAA